MSEAANQTDKLHLLKQKVDAFSKARDWEKFHTPKNLSMALTVEASELMEIFQWLDPQEAFTDLSDKKKTAVEHEVADIFIYLLRFCSVTGIDLIGAAEEKLKHNAEKYPAELVKGQSKKYTEY
ncbi:nucleotide pyrophosphohydrolase [Pseudomonas brenneri]|uniref:NTP pyrophosphatase, house-cleaning of non-canonical NTPs n=1 Tax=Pseudomonas brenneri TaxID=129817 RepID=A0A5B2UKZ8_9PSED|nr:MULTISPECIES: nucleotide pyrophosphohydrolase [Pseudomonas fluorescens group]KAA2226729.1 nucleotide pyrophosphohydrolase [Pseudomonas brenneri]NVZ22628.1 nucleotide pyrophosphohydrolase [Pseudomonas costantinii]TWR74868.1 nucleotide pyrophosphohydrolase [Pseudomonas brenneri]SDU90873.1 NTP pyrophosphatase, house-cleaning of non-canonical NTPs [Pseudomonas brenneri]GGL61357.1 nucleotide pyrophosphohydrolase [Pseudomonas brenneri]